ncbi:MAG: undecaprenyl-diphosphatase UppP [Patescibacteria group bacterium]|jgi:undecaprenyl-diphosphatase|nr:undecaprenyl-diphosphatase UppP [Patescibacteria group bacterium]
MDYFYSIFAGIIQGLTEFLPVSSSGHLVLFHDFLGFDFPDQVAFDVVLHLGTLVALLLFFHRDVIKYLLAFFRSLYQWRLKQDVDQRLAWYLFLATIPAGIFGYWFESEIETIFRSPVIVAWMLIIVGLLLYFADSFFKKEKDIEQLTFMNAMNIGLAQALALVPGVSRSGITIITGLSQKLKRDQAARFSFLLSMPIVFAAGLKKTVDLVVESGLQSVDYLILILGFVSSAVTGYFCIKYFLRFLRDHSLTVFVFYRIVLGLVILIAILFFK